ncbi:MAG: sensor histidine kinase [Campylobacterota bacterium]
MNSNKNLTYWLISLPIIAVLITASILTYQFISNEKKDLNRTKKDIEKKLISQIKQTIENRVNRTIELIQRKIELNNAQEKKALEDVVNIGYKTIKHIYSQNNHLPKENIIEKIKEQLRNIRFYNNSNGYYFLVDLENRVILQPNTPKYENKTLTNLKDTKGNYFIKEFKKIAKNQKEGFHSWYWNNPATNKLEEKLGFIKVFEPLNLYIGSARYQSDIKKSLQKELIHLISNLKYSKQEYVFVINDKGVVLSHINKDFINKSFKKLGDHEERIISNILKKAKENSDGSFIGYTPTSFNVSQTNLSKKISFVKRIDELGWTIGTGKYTITINEQIKQEEKYLENRVANTINNIIVVSIIISFILSIFLFYIAKKIQNRFSQYDTQLNIKNKKLEKLNRNLEDEVNIQLDKLRQKDKILYQQSKLASMGEMIGNIAHQWRQPLSVISTAASGTLFQDELDTLDKKTLNENLNTIIKNTQQLSCTIDDFRNFFNSNKEKTNFKLTDVISKVLSLTSTSFKNKDIKIVNSVKPIEIYNLENELTQAIINILNNAKDALLENNPDNKLIFISTKELKNNKVILKIEDNAGGIDEQIIEKIFEPYFTTKFQAQGTGIGLYMSRSIIVDNMKGEISAKNSTLVYKNKEYKAACFEIVLDKKS